MDKQTNKSNEQVLRDRALGHSLLEVGKMAAPKLHHLNNSLFALDLIAVNINKLHNLCKNMTEDEFSTIVNGTNSVG